MTTPELIQVVSLFALGNILGYITYYIYIRFFS